MKMNGCINILSSRTNCLPHCLKSIYDCWNNKFNYPVYVHYFDDIYEDEKYRNFIWENISKNIHFKQIPYKTPEFLDESELFYNRQNLDYVRSGFSINRKGYLHMCHFYNNMHIYPGTNMHNHDYILSVDDESMFTKQVPYDFFEVIESKEEMAGALKVTDSKNKPPRGGNFDTRVGMRQHVIDYMTKFNLDAKCDFIERIADKVKGEEIFHNELIYSDSYVFKTKLFKTRNWKNWNSFLNQSGGIYKYRWGDHELNALFFLVHYGKPVFDFKTVDEGYHDQGGLRYIQNLAPNVKDISK